jgi:Uma2 family endonuclease
MSIPRTGARVTYEEYRNLPETGPRYQLIDGELILSPSPNRRHQQIVARIFFAIFGYLKVHRIGEVYIAPLDVILSNWDAPQPDLIYVSEGRKNVLVPEGISGAPDLCVEVLSPSSRRLDLGRKRALYARHGVREYWVVDPERNTVDVDRFEKDSTSPVEKLEAGGTLKTDLLPGFSLSLREVFEP